MSQIQRLIKEHKKGALIALLVLLLFISSSVISAINVAHKRAHDAKTEETTPSSIQAQEKQTEKQDVPLTDNQESLIHDYNQETKDFITKLTRGTWTTTDDSSAVTFTDNEYTISIQGNPETHTYAISRLTHNEDTQGGQHYTIAMETDTGTHIATYEEITGMEATNPAEGIQTTLTSETMFGSYSMTLTRIDSVPTITLTDYDADAALYLGDTDKLTEAFSQWIVTNYPRTTEARWNQFITIDYQNKTVMTSFTLVNEVQPSISVTYNTDTQTYTFEN